MKTGTVFLAAMLIGAALCVSGCSRISKQNYDKVELGMDYGQVMSILGSDARCDAIAGAKECTWGDAEKNIKVKFIADKVVFKSSDGMEGK